MKNKSKNEIIRVKAMCLFERDGKLFVSKNYDRAKKETFYRVIGGSVEFSETAEEAVRRELREELNLEIENLQFLTVVENIFTFEGEKGHEIIFLYKGDLSDKDIYKKESISYVEAGGKKLSAEWIKISDVLEERIKLYPPFDYKKFLN